MAGNGSQRPATDIAPSKPRGGRPPGPWGEKQARNALLRAANQRDPITKQRYLDIAMRTLVRQACNGDNVCLGMLLDRIDGKAQGSPGDGQARLSFVVHMPAPMAREDWQRMALDHVPVVQESAPAEQGQGYGQGNYAEQGQGSGDQGDSNGQDQGSDTASEVASHREAWERDAVSVHETSCNVVELSDHVNLGELGAKPGAVPDEEPE